MPSLSRLKSTGVMLLVAAALVPHGRCGHERCGRRSFDCLTISGQYGSPLLQLGVTTLTSARRPGEVGLTLRVASRVAFLYLRSPRN